MAVGIDGSPGAILHAQFAQDVAHVRLHRLDADKQFIGDFLVGLTLGNEDEHLQFPGRELMVGQLFAAVMEFAHHLGGNLRFDHRFLLHCPADGLHDFLGLGGFQQIAEGPRFQGGEDQAVIDEAGEDDNLSFRQLRLDLLRGLHASALFHEQVHEDHIWLQLPGQPHRGFAGGGFAHYLQILFRFQIGADAAPDHLVVINHQDSDSFHYSSLLASTSWEMGTLTSSLVPWPGTDSHCAVPPMRVQRSWIDRMPRDDWGILSSTNPLPLSSMTKMARGGVSVTLREMRTRSASAWRSTLERPSWAMR